tara:strand:- start:1270 stop:1593 length:324 start_codon:yes stop_codon:yes gene_type:complete
MKQTILNRISIDHTGLEFEEMIRKSTTDTINKIVYNAMDEWLEISVIKNMIKNEIAPNPSTKTYTENFEILIDNYKEIASELTEYNESPKIKKKNLPIKKKSKIGKK